MKNFFGKWDSRKWLGMLLAMALLVYLAGGETAVTYMEGIPTKLKGFVALLESMKEYVAPLGIILVYLGWNKGQAAVDVEKEKAKQ